MTATQTTKKTAAKKAPAKKAAPAAKKAAAKPAPAAKGEAPTALHREYPFGKDGGAIYYNSITDRWYAQARIVLDGEPKRKTTVARDRDAAYDALVAIRSGNTLVAKAAK